MKYVVGTRGSRLSLAQTGQVISLLKKSSPDTEYEIKTITTKGDTDSRPLFEMNQRGIFAKEIDRAVVQGEVDFAVHSLKDVPSTLDDGLVLGCVPRRHQANDVLVSQNGSSLESLKNGALVGTSSLRRAVQIKRQRPDIVVRPVRGNIETRITKAQDQYDGIILALAGIERLEIDAKYTILSTDTFVPSPGQGALALVSQKDSPILPVLQKIEHGDSRLEADAERAFSESVESGCRFPVGAHAVCDGSQMTLTADAFSADGRESLRVVITGEKSDPNSIGRRAGEDMHGRGVGDLALNWRKKTEEWNR
ncbi:MAG: hydroxymethylbilane synthase [Nitrosopumilus sp. B06]|nr:MAG: hydroxymethylbilane synthase [Nitrosopumilus sp. B06]